MALVVLKVVNISGLVYIGLVGPEGFYREVFRQGLIVIKLDIKVENTNS